MWQPQMMRKMVVSFDRFVTRRSERNGHYNAKFN